MRKFWLFFIASLLLHTAVFSISVNSRGTEESYRVINVSLEYTTSADVNVKANRKGKKERKRANVKKEVDMVRESRKECDQNSNFHTEGRVSAFISKEPPRVKKLLKPSYTSIAKEMGIEGTVLVELFISEEGKPLNGRVIKGLGYGLDEEALKALLLSEFEPARRGGIPVPVKVIVPVKFKLK